MTFYSFTNSTRLEVKWVNKLRGNFSFLHTPHANPYYELIAVTDGPVYFQLEADKLLLQPGECLLLSPWENHQGWKPIEDFHGFFWVQFSAEPGPLRIDDMKEASRQISFIPPTKSDLRTTESNQINLLIPQRIRTERRYELLLAFEKLLHESSEPAGYYRVRQNILLWSILEQLGNETIRQHHVDSSLPTSFGVYRRVVNPLEENYTRNISKELIERTVNRKYEYICQVFKKYSGTTISHYTLQLRLQKAKHLLLASSSNLQEIVNEVGFSDAYYFSRLFKKMVGISPAMLRKSGFINE